MMSMLKRLSAVTLRTKLTVVLVCFAAIPSLILTGRMLSYYTEDMVMAASQNVHSIVARDNKLMEAQLSRIEDASYTLLTNPKCYEVFRDMPEMKISDLMNAERIIAPEISGQLTLAQFVYQFELYSPQPRWMFGKTGSIPLTPGQIDYSGLPEMAYVNKGAALWVGGQEFASLFGSSYMRSRTYDYQYPIIMARTMDFQYTQNAQHFVLPPEQERPVLLVFLLEKTLRETYDGTIGYTGTETFIMNQDGLIVSSNSSRFPITEQVPDGLQTLSGESGYLRQTVFGEEALLCYDTSATTGWTTVAVVPMKALLEDTSRNILRLFFRLSMVMLIISLAIALLLSNTITKPIAILVRSARRIATGDFSADTPIPSGGDFKVLAESFNHMEREITRLIEENYKITLREKDTQIMALNLQMNPHFLYNTLNTINILAIENSDLDTSDLIVSLSTMLQYTFRSTEEKIPLVDEIHWTQNYLRIMSARFQNVFHVEFHIAEGLYDHKVPKFFLQPLVENSIIHGFADRESGGLITISAQKEGECLHFVIADNGRGMTEDEVENNVFRASHDSGIGVSNVHRRLMLMYGERYQVRVESSPGEGTAFHMVIPSEYS